MVTLEVMYTGWTNFLRNQWPDNIELLYYSFHLMITLGHDFHRADGLCQDSRTWRGRLESSTCAAVGVDAGASLSLTSPTLLGG